MKKYSRILWKICFVAVIILALVKGQKDYSNSISTWGTPASFYYGFNLFIYVGGFLYLTLLIKIISGILKSFKILDKRESVRQVIAKFFLFIFLCLPIIYYFVFGI